MFLKAEIPDILLVSEGIFREWTRATGLCLLFCPHSASFHQTYFMLFCSCALSQPVIGTDKSVVLGLFFLIFLFHLIKTCGWLCLLTLDSSWGLLWELLENLLLVLCCVLIVLPVLTCEVNEAPHNVLKVVIFPLSSQLSSNRQFFSYFWSKWFFVKTGEQKFI